MKQPFVHKGSTAFFVLLSYSGQPPRKRPHSSSNCTKDIKITFKSSVRAILPILIVACLLITSCESGVNLVTSCNGIVQNTKSI